MVMIVLFAVPVSAAETETYSEVYSDLSRAVLEGETFDPADYPKNTSDTGIYLLTVNEAGYSTSDMSDYGFYIYLYNPSGQAISVASERNRIQLATAWNDDDGATDYAKFYLEFVSVSSEEGYEYVFYKAKVGTRVDSTVGIENYITVSKRLYDISGIEIQRLNAYSAIEYTVGMRYAYSGTEAKNNKTCQASKIDTISAEVYPTYFRTESASQVNHTNQLNAVYFNVSKEYWEKYTNLYAIKYSMYEYRTTPVIVTDNADVYSELLKWQFISVGEYDASNSLALYSEPTSAGTGTHTWVYPWSYNVEQKFNASYIVASEEICDQISWMFYESDEIELRQENVTSQEMIDFWNANRASSTIVYDPNLLTTEGVSDVYPDRKAGYQETTAYFDDTFRMESYDETHNWLQKLLDYNIFNGGAGTNTSDTYDGIQAIEQVAASDAKLDAEVLAKKYFINSNDATQFKQIVEEGIKKNMVTVVFRFAVTDYFSEEVTAKIDGKVVDGTTYRAEQTVFLDFDIISLTFEKDMNYYVIPVSSSPTDIIGGIDSPQVDKDASIENAAGYVKDLFDDLFTETKAQITVMPRAMETRRMFAEAAAMP